MVPQRVGRSFSLNLRPPEPYPISLSQPIPSPLPSAWLVLEIWLQPGGSGAVGKAGEGLVVPHTSGLWFHSARQERPDLTFPRPESSSGSVGLAQRQFWTVLS